jgi:hypothetical protein
MLQNVAKRLGLEQVLWNDLSENRNETSNVKWLIQGRSRTGNATVRHN